MRRLNVFFLVIFVGIITSCGTINIRNHYNGVTNKSPVSEQVILKYRGEIQVFEMNNDKVNWSMTTGDKIIHLKEGSYTFKVQYSSSSYVNYDQIQTMTSKKVLIGPYNLEKGKTYEIYGFIDGDKIFFKLASAL